MPVRYLVDPVHRAVLVHAEGRVTADDLLGAIRGYLGHPAWEPTFSVLWDARSIRAIEADWQTAEAARDVAGSFGERLGPGRTAVVTSREVDRTVAEMYGVLVRRSAERDPGRELRLFTALHLARAWLELPPDAPNGA